MKKIQKITTCNRLDLETVGIWPIMPQNLPRHWPIISQHWFTHSRAVATRDLFATFFLAIMNLIVWLDQFWPITSTSTFLSAIKLSLFQSLFGVVQRLSIYLLIYIYLTSILTFLSRLIVNISIGYTTKISKVTSKEFHIFTAEISWSLQLLLLSLLITLRGRYSQQQPTRIDWSPRAQVSVVYLSDISNSNHGSSLFESRDFGTSCYHLIHCLWHRMNDRVEFQQRNLKR